MDALAAFLTSCVNEDEAAARAATPGPWVVGRTADIDGDHYGSHVAAMGAEKRPLLTMCAGYHPSRHVAVAEHIARHDPARALREVEFKRKVIARHQDVHRCDWGERRGSGFGPCSTVRDLAEIYSDRPGYAEAIASDR